MEVFILVQLGAQDEKPKIVRNINTSFSYHGRVRAYETIGPAKAGQTNLAKKGIEAIVLKLDLADGTEV